MMIGSIEKTDLYDPSIVVGKESFVVFSEKKAMRYFFKLLPEKDE
jgi:hypothetical protein